MLLDRPDDEDSPRGPYLWWTGLIALLVTEILVLTLRFDAGTMLERGGWVASLIGRTHLLISLGICVCTVVWLVLLGPSRGEREGWPSARPNERNRRAWPYLLGHLGAFGYLAWLTGSIFEGTALSESPLRWAGLWLVAGLATLFLWMLAALPLSDWKRLVWDRWRVVLFAGLAGAAALVLAGWTSSLWEVFPGSTFRAVRGVLSLFYAEIVCQPDELLLGTSRFQVAISPQCSGFEGIGLIWAFLAACFWWFRHRLRFPQAFLLIPVGTALSWMFNVMRIAALIALGDRGWDAVAVGGFHSQAGWLAFNGIALGLVAVAVRMPFFASVGDSMAQEAPDAVANPTAAYVAPLLAIALTTMITGALSDGGFDRLYAARVLAAAAALWSFRHEYGALRGLCSWHAVGVGLAVFAIWTALEPAPSSGEAGMAVSDALARMPKGWAWSWLAARAIGSVVVVPVAEELAFRGFLTRRLIAADFRAVPEGGFTWPSFVVSSLLFGVLHQRWLAGTIAGMAYAVAYYRRGRLIDAIAAHALTNLLITMSVLATGEWSRWS